MTRSRIALAIAALGLAAGAVGAIGPARHVRTTYSWPPDALSAQSPDRLWYTPLLLVRRRPDDLSARIPCRLPKPLPHAHRPATVLATARFPEQVGGLALVQDARRLTLEVGGGTLATVTIPLQPSSDCAYELRVAGSSWSLHGGPQGAELGGDLPTMPVVTGLFSGLDLRSPSHPTIDVTTAVNRAHPRVLQVLAWIVASVCVLVAMLITASAGRPRRPFSRLVDSARRAALRLRAVDVVVVAALLGWWFVGPAFFDDGWVMARGEAFSTSGGFSNYYDSLGGNQPLAYWNEWLQHWLLDASHALLVLRIPALLALAVTWFLCRWILARLVGVAEGTVVWALSSAFVVAAFAWGMTLRPEPFMAVLVTGVLVCSVRFSERESAAPLVVAALFVVFALAAHPAGIVTLAPLLAIAPRLVPWLRAQAADALTIVTAASAALVVLAFVGSDLSQRRVDAQTIRVYGDAASSWREEVKRYAYLLDAYYGTPLRRESVALIALAVAAYLLRPRREEASRLDLGAVALALAVLLLIPTPSKWPWHFGTLIGLVAVAVATESARLRRLAQRAAGWSLRPFLVIAATVVIAAWSWSPRFFWNDLDLRTLDWTPAFESSTLNLSKLGAAVPVLVLVAVGIVTVVRGGRLRAVPWRASSWALAAISVPLVAFTVGVLVADAVKTGSWTLTRQNLETIASREGCGLANDALVADIGSVRRASSSLVRSAPIDGWVPDPPIAGVARFVIGPVGDESVARSPWFRFGPGQLGVFLAGSVGEAGLPVVEWGRSRSGSIRVLESALISSALAREVGTSMLAWRFLPASELPQRPQGANAMRILLTGGSTSGAQIAVTEPVTYTNVRLEERLAQEGDRTLVLPNLRTYVPCAQQPRIHDGIVEPPTGILGLRDALFPVLGRDTSPFESLLDVYRLERLPLTDSPDPPANVVLYHVDRRIPGGVVAAPRASETAS